MMCKGYNNNKAVIKTSSEKRRHDEKAQGNQLLFM